MLVREVTNYKFQITNMKRKEGRWEDEKIGSWEKTRRKEDDGNHPNERFFEVRKGLAAPAY
jgi:hypothetical protein